MVQTRLLVLVVGYLGRTAAQLLDAAGHERRERGSDGHDVLEGCRNAVVHVGRNFGDSIVVVVVVMVLVVVVVVFNRGSLHCSGLCFGGLLSGCLRCGGTGRCRNH